MDLDKRFLEAKERVTHLEKKPSNEVLLQLYALNKQAVVGEINVPSPGVFDFVGQAKYNAWKELSGMAPETAKEQYVNLVDSLFRLQAGEQADSEEG